MFLLYRTLRCLVFPMTLVCNDADPLTEAKGKLTSKLGALQADRRIKQEEAEERAKAELAEAAKKAKLAKLARQPAKYIPRDPKPPATAKAKSASPAKAASATAAKGSAVDPKAKVASIQSGKAAGLPSRYSAATDVKAKPKFPIPDRGTALTNIQAVFRRRYSDATLGDVQLEAKAATIKASSQILTYVKTFVYTLLSLDILSLGILSLGILSIEGFVFKHVVFR